MSIFNIILKRIRNITRKRSFNNKYVFQYCTKKWETRTGKRIYPKNMTTLHIQNSIKMVDRICFIERMAASDYEIYRILSREIALREETNLC